MTLADHALSHLRAISPYLPGKPITQLARELGLPVERIVKLASNENPLGMSPKARRAVSAALSGAERYPDPFELTAALAQRCQVAPEQIVLGNGSNDLLDLVARVFLAPGRSAVLAQYAFAIYPLATLSAGAEAITVPARDYGHDLTAMAAAVRPDTRVLWIANPNNPTGSFLPAPKIHAFLKKLPPTVAVVLDEAYNDYLPPEDRVDTAAWIADFPNLIVVRTFSKIYGLAGLRIGYALASAPVADLMNRIRQPFNVNNLALAGALAALDDKKFLLKSYEQNRRGMLRLTAGLEALAYEYIPSRANFLTFRAGSVDDTVAVNWKLLQKGIIVRPLASYGLPAWLRVTIGSDVENFRFLNALENDETETEAET